MKTIKFLVPVICIGLIAMSCSKSSTPAPVSASVAQTTFSSVNTDVSAAISGLNTAPGNVALNSFSNLSNVSSPFGRVSSYKKPGEIKAAMSAGLVTIRQMLLKTTTNNKRVADSEPFDFAKKVGTYTWNFDQQVWGYDPGGSIIKIDYPKDANSTTNDAELQITAYTETQIGSDYYPTDIEAAIYTPIGTKQLGLVLTAGYDSDGNENKGSVALFINPYTISLSFDDTQTNTATESFSFSQGSTVYIGTSVTATFASAADQTNDNPSKVTGYIQLETVRFDMTIDGTTQSNNPNDYVTGTVTVNGGVAGHVIFVSNSNGGYDPYVEYNDNTRDPLKTVFADLSTQINSLGQG